MLTLKELLNFDNIFFFLVTNYKANNIFKLELLFYYQNKNVIDENKNKINEERVFYSFYFFNFKGN